MAQTTYCTVADVKLFLGIQENTDDTLLESLVKIATAIVNTQTRRVFIAPTDDETRIYFTDGRLSDDYLEMWIGDDIFSITSITNYDGSSLSTSDIFQLPINQIPKNHIRIKTSASKNFGYGDIDEYISITGKFAYSATPPEDIKHAAIRLTAWIYRQKDGGGDLDRPLMTGEGTVILPAMLPRDVEIYLIPYRKEVYNG